MRQLAPFAFALALLGCSTAVQVMPGPVAQLARMEQAQQAGRTADIAGEKVDAACASTPFSSEACPKIHALRAGACLALAQQQAADGAACPPPTGSAATQINCAADSYALAGDGVLANSGDAAAALQNRGQARYCAARLRPPAEGLAMARAAMADLARPPASGGRDLMAASAALFIAQSTAAPAAERCDAARQATQLAERGLATPDAAPAVLAALRGTRTAAQAEAAAITRCQGS